MRRLRKRGQLWNSLVDLRACGVWRYYQLSENDSSHKTEGDQSEGTGATQWNNAFAVSLRPIHPQPHLVAEKSETSHHSNTRACSKWGRLLVTRQDKDNYHAGYRDGRDADTLSEPSASYLAAFGLRHKHPPGPRPPS
jgi:hypothetical protein